MVSKTICLLAFIINAFFCGMGIYKNYYAASVGWAAFGLYYLSNYIIISIKEHIDSKFK